MKLLLLILTIAVGYALNAQDSVALKVISKPQTINDTTYYLVRIDWMDHKEKVIVKCCCRDKTIRQKGEMVMVAKKDLIFE